MLIEIKYGIGYGSHTMEIEVEDDATDDEIDTQVHDFVMERVDYGWEKQS